MGVKSTARVSSLDSAELRALFTLDGGPRAVLLPPDRGVRGLLELACRHGLKLKRYREGEPVHPGNTRRQGSPFWFGQTAEREWTVWVARHSTGWSVRIVCQVGELRLSHATPDAVWTGLASLLGADWSWQLGVDQ